MTALKFQFKHTLDDLRGELLPRIALLLLVFSGIMLYLLFAIQPFQPVMFTLWVLVGLLSWGGYRFYPRYPNLTRYGFISGLVVVMLLGVWFLSEPWVAFLGLPLIFLAAMLVSYSWLAVGGSLLAVITLKYWYAPQDYSLILLWSVISLNMLITWRTVEIFYTALMWYSSMQQRADQLLEETREHRAKLLSAIKSLEIAYQTKHQIQQELIRARQQAEEARKLKERFAANISHELRTPLNLILGFSEVMYLSPEVYGEAVSFPPKLRRDIYQIHRSSRHLLDMVDDVLDLSHIEGSGFGIRLELTDLKPFIEDTLDITQGLFKGTSVPLEVQIEPDLPPLEIDRTRIRQVILNLLNNAQRFTPTGKVTLAVTSATNEVLFSVHDTGIGIPADKLAQVFEEFFQVDYSLSRSHGGAGLGLAITKRFVEAHNGRIWVESIEGEGSTFYFTLPVSDYWQHWQIQPLDPTWSTEAKPYLAVLESDPTVIGMLRRFLNAYHILPLEDITQLPTLLTTYQPTALIRNLSPQATYPAPPILELPIIDCTLPSKRWIIDQLGVRGYLAKPMTAQQLIEQVKNVGDVQKILIVDDDRGFVQMIERMLETSGTLYEILRAYDGKQGLEILLDHTPDLLLLDLAMPDIDGFEMIHHIHSHLHLANLPIILLTATTYITEGAEQYGDLRLTQTGGLNPTEVISCLNAVLPHLKPR